MLEKPALQAEKIITYLQDAYGLLVRQVIFLARLGDEASADPIAIKLAAGLQTRWRIGQIRH